MSELRRKIVWSNYKYETLTYPNQLDSKREQATITTLLIQHIYNNKQKLKKVATKRFESWFFSKYNYANINFNFHYLIFDCEAPLSSYAMLSVSTNQTSPSVCNSVSEAMAAWPSIKYSWQHLIE